MGMVKSTLILTLSPPIPIDIVNHTLDEYSDIKQSFFIRRYQPAELNGARFCESVLRLVEFLDVGIYTPFGSPLSSEAIINRARGNKALPNTFRFYVPMLCRVMLDVRNKRDVAHVGGEVSPNFSDALLVTQVSDWILTEIIRHFHSCSVDDATKIVKNINEVRVPIIASIDGFLRVQNTKMTARDKTLVILYHEHPDKVSDTNLFKWIEYSNASHYKNSILKNLHSEALIHYASGLCVLLPKGLAYVQKNIKLDIIV